MHETSNKLETPIFRVNQKDQFKPTRRRRVRFSSFIDYIDEIFTEIKHIYIKGKAKVVWVA